MKEAIIKAFEFGFDGDNIHNCFTNDEKKTVRNTDLTNKGTRYKKTTYLEYCNECDKLRIIENGTYFCPTCGETIYCFIKEYDENDWMEKKSVRL